MASYFQKCSSKIKRFNKANLKEEFYQFFGLKVGLKSNSAEVISQLNRIFSPFRVKNSSPLDLQLSIFAEEGLPLSPDNLKVLVKSNSSEDQFSDDGYHFEFRRGDAWSIQLARYLGSHIFKKFKFYKAHAGAVALGKKGLLFPGISGSGKSSLVYALAKQGFEYIADDLALIDPKSCQMVPFPANPFFEEGSGSLFEEVQAAFNKDEVLFYSGQRKCAIELEKLGVRFPTEPVEVKYIIFSSYNGQLRPQLRRIPKHQALVKLFQSGSLFLFTSSSEKTAMMEIVMDLTERAECFELISNELEETTQLIWDLVKQDKRG